MKILIDDNWTDGFLDYYPNPGEYTIRVMAWMNLEKSEDLYFIRPKSLRLVWNYFREIGPIEVFRKIRSRSEEKFRNEKFVSCGIGKIIRPSANSKFSANQVVGFIAPNFPACVERLSLPEDFLIEIDSSLLTFLSPKEILYLPLVDNSLAKDCWWHEYRAWNSFSGINISLNCSEKAEKLYTAICSANWRTGQRLSIETSSPIVYRRKATKGCQMIGNKKTAALFGYGNYAKTIIIPKIKTFFNLLHIHEIDPLQIPAKDALHVIWDTSPFPAEHERYDVFFIAGFHHTHAPIAIAAMEKGACAVVEKPIVVDQGQLNDLVGAIKKTHGCFFACFHKRYLPMNKWAFEDMQLSRGEPVSYHCIVYEVPLPEYHWYNWPNSKSRIISNGCHWIDHFLYLNNYSNVTDFDIKKSSGGTINCSVELDNGAFFTMVLTDKGSERIGVQDYIELRSDDVTVKMINGSIYQSENRSRILRRSKTNKMISYKRMYEEICQAIAAGESGDSLKSVIVSSKLVLALHDALNEKSHS